MPPCFWSINAFSPHALSVVHDNPAEKQFPPINEQLPAYSVFSWPFKLSFVRDRKEEREYGKYYPKPIFESRIQKFQNHLRDNESVVFLYSNYSNPVSGEDYQYLLVGCAFLAEKGPFNHFDPTKELLKAKRKQPGMQNFPTLNWALRYSLDIEQTGVRLPYQEYLRENRRPGGISNSLLEEIKVTITESELTDGFKYVANHVDDDQAIYLLMKLRKGILKVKEHGLQIDYDADTALQRTDQLLAYTWKKRGYVPGLKNLAQAALSLSPADTERLDALICILPLNERQSIERLQHCLTNPDEIGGELEPCEGVLCELSERIDTLGIDVGEFLQLATLNLTSIQFDRIIRRQGLRYPLRKVCNNLYLIYEEYEPGKMLEDANSGEKIDGPIDLFKVDIALFPHLRFLKRTPILHPMKINDPRRLRAVTIAELSISKDEGHCFDEANSLEERTKQYPLFYQSGTEYETDVDFTDLPSAYLSHFREKLVMRKEDDKTYFYLKTVYDEEQLIANTVQELMRAKELDSALPSLADDLEEAVHRLAEKIGKWFDREQFCNERRNLYQKFPTKRFFVISGTPGSGKSYELLKIVDRLTREGEKSLILTLTGKAALRLKNNTEGFKGIDAKTIDKFLVECERLGEGKFVVPNLIIDEMSMVDLDKLAEILKRINIRSPYFKRLILVGDENQLPPIGSGKVFEDILEYLRNGDSSTREHWAHLEVNCRAEMSPEFLNFCQIFSNQSKNYEQWLSQVDKDAQLCPGLAIRRWQTHEELYRQIEAQFLSLFSGGRENSADKNLVLDQVFGIQKGTPRQKYTLDRFQIISPYRTGLSGASGLNFYFQEVFRSDKKFSGATGEIVFKLNDKVMHTQNEYREDELFVSNGSLGVVTGYSQIQFIDHDKPVKLSDLRDRDQLELAFAITVHKAQGSGFDHTFVVIPKRYGFISRELLYTALTRAKESATIFIQVGGDEHDAAKLLNYIRRASAVETRRTSLLKEKDISFAYLPDSSVTVKSRVEYIIFKKLEDYRTHFGNFDFKYEEAYKLKDQPFDLHPDFTIRLATGVVVYWEHLGRLTSRSYLRDWDERRRIYKKNGDLDKVLTTDELHGISDSKISAIIEALVDGKLRSEDSSNCYSRCHYSLR